MPNSFDAYLRPLSVPYMQEVFSSVADPSKPPVTKQVYYEPAIENSTDSLNPGIVFRETRHFWGERDGRFMCEYVEEWRPTLRSAENRYKRRRQALAMRGFFSDLNPLM